MKYIIALVLLGLITPSLSKPQNIYVSNNVNPNSGDGTKGNPYGSFYEAVESGAPYGSTILANPGTYKGKYNTNIIVLEKIYYNFDVVKEKGSVIIDFEFEQVAFINITNAGSSDISVNGYIFQNQQPSIYIPALAFNNVLGTVTVTSCIFKNLGRGMLVNDLPTLNVDNCTFDNITSIYYNGPSITAMNVAGVISNSVFENGFGEYGGAINIYLTQQDSLTFDTVKFSNNTSSRGYGHNIYMSERSSDLPTNVKLTNCEVDDRYGYSFNNAGGFLLFENTCNIPGLTGSATVCGCPNGARIINLNMVGGSVSTDSNLQLNGQFSAKQADFTGISSDTCNNLINNNNNNDDNDSDDVAILMAVTYQADLRGSQMTSTNINWLIEPSAFVSMSVEDFDLGNNDFTLEGAMLVYDSNTIHCGAFHNNGNLQLEQKSVLDCKVTQTGIMELLYGYAPELLSDVASIKSQVIKAGASLEAYAGDSYQIGDSFYLLQYQSNTGEFQFFNLNNLVGGIEDTVLVYQNTSLGCQVVSETDS